MRCIYIYIHDNERSQEKHTGAKATTYTTCVNMDGKGAIRDDANVLAAHWFQ